MMSIVPESELIETVTLADPLGSCTHGDKSDVLCCLKELNSVILCPLHLLNFFISFSVVFYIHFFNLG